MMVWRRMRRFTNPAEEVPDPFEGDRAQDRGQLRAAHQAYRASGDPTPYRRLCLGERDSLALCVFGIKNGHVQNGESALDTEARFFCGFAGQIRRFSLAVYLQPKSPILRWFALSERALRLWFGSRISARSESS